MRVTTWSLELTTPGESAVAPLPDGVRVDRAAAMSPEYARFLNGLVGGPWRWVDRLGWTREQWVEELGVPGTEFLLAYGDGQPRGFVHLQAQSHPEGSQVEIRYFGLVEDAIGRGLGRGLLERGLEAAWTLPERHDLAPVRRVWLHTCSLDGPAALDNYRARGFVVFDERVTEEEVPDEPLGAWVSTGGPAPTGEATGEARAVARPATHVRSLGVVAADLDGALQLAGELEDAEVPGDQRDGR